MRTADASLSRRQSVGSYCSTESGDSAGTEGPGEPERVLVIVLAQTRAHEHTFGLFKRNLLDVYRADLALCVSNSPREDTSNPFYSHAKYVWGCDEPDDWGEAFDQAQATLKVDADWRCLLAVKKQWLGGIKGENAHPGSGGILLYFRWFLKQQLMDQALLDKYDRFIVTRSDFVHLVPAPPLKLLAQDKIWIPYGEAWGGITDRHILVGRDHILPVLSVPDAILETPDALYRKMAHASNWNLERYLKFAFEQNGLLSHVQFYPYTMYLIRAVGGQTRWGVGIYDLKLGYHIKYRGEFRRAMLAKRIIGTHGRWTPWRMWLLMRLADLVDLVTRLRGGFRKLRRGGMSRDRGHPVTSDQ